ncbi:hypothetical protein N9Z95_06750, partial [Akkermansiaceae bacterium]|nr:hypothetical protein [Akkermansiaceae bacterium]
RRLFLKIRFGRKGSRWCRFRGGLHHQWLGFRLREKVELCLADNAKREIVDEAIDGGMVFSFGKRGLSVDLLAQEVKFGRAVAMIKKSGEELLGVEAPPSIERSQCDGGIILNRGMLA